MEILITWLLFIAVQLAATMSPGPAFAMSVRNSMSFGRKGGVMTALGLGLGVGFHTVLVLGGLALVLSQSVILFQAIKYIGAAYLVYVGFKALRAKAPNVSDIPKAKDELDYRHISAFKAIWMGLLTNALNPKAVIFFTAVFTQFISPDAPLGIMVLYAATVMIVEAGWFSLLAVLLTHEKVNRKVRAAGHWIERVCGGLMVGLGVKLALSKI
ncbi:MAG: LysE family translocator [Micavibrio sp.]|nr:LysE family translocator [Micavibrio sp.]